MRVIILFVGAMLMACSTEPIDSIDTTEASLARSPDPDVPEYDPEYLRDLSERATGMVFRLAPRLDAHEVDKVMAGELTPQEAFELDDEEFTALVREFERIATESEASLPDYDMWQAEKKNDGKGPKDNEKCDDNYELCLATVFAGGVRAGPWGVVVAIVGGTYCLCQHCSGGRVDGFCEVVRW